VEILMANSQPDGYLVFPSSGGGRPVLVLHAWWGLNDTVREVCNRLAASGYLAFAPDLYHGQVANHVAAAEKLSANLFKDLESARTEASWAAQFLARHPEQTGSGLAVIGFSLGAFFALDLSVYIPDQVRSVVIFYGTRPGGYRTAKASYLGHFAEMDEFEPQKEIDSLEEALRNAGRPVTFHQYKGTGHWFFEPDRPGSFNPQAAKLAWERTLTFLDETLA
jgi:carboxymethylenebutenolidase